ncbi:hypothetical protein ACOMHN_035015 [Nucella lapillus]
MVEPESEGDLAGLKTIEDIFLDDEVPSAHALQRQAKKKQKIKGTPDPSIPVSDVPCSGCGAELHCQDPVIPGYMPSEKFKCLTRKDMRTSVCQRCFLIQAYNMFLNVRVSAETYPQILKEIKRTKSLVVVVVDLFDMKNSVFENLLTHIGTNRPLFIVGNKVDLIPRDSKGYLERTRQTLIDMCNSAGLNPTGKNIKHVCLVSAKTGYGIEHLVTKLMTAWQLKGHVHVVGSTNVGKSTLFNALLMSDYCKAVARGFINRATVSVWPGTTLNLLKFVIVSGTTLKEQPLTVLKFVIVLGTTLNLLKSVIVSETTLNLLKFVIVSGTTLNLLKSVIVSGTTLNMLKFPIVNPAPWRLALRFKRLVTEGKEYATAEELRRSRLEDIGSYKADLLTGHIGLTDFRSARTLEEDRAESERQSAGQDLVSFRYSKGDSFDEASGPDPLASGAQGPGYKPESFRMYWCNDTPGVVNPEQIINLLEPEELSAILPRTKVRPQCLVLRPGQVLLVTGMGRIDYVQGRTSVYLTAYVSHAFKLHVLKDGAEADEFHRSHLGTSSLGIPLGDEDRLSRIPALVGREFQVTGTQWNVAAADIQLSSLGWVSVSAGPEMAVSLRAYTPGGKGLYLRSPSLLPNYTFFRGARKGKTPFYRPARRIL